jgi:hypothetical protein
LLVRPDADDISGVKDDDLVGMHDRADSLRHDDRNGICGFGAQSGTQASVSGGVEG